MKINNLIGFIVFALCVVADAEFIDTGSPEWKKARIDRILSDLESKDYARIHRSLCRIGAISEQIPSQDLEKMKSLMYGLLDVDIQVAASHKPPLLNAKCFPINVTSANVLAQIVNYDESIHMEMPDNFIKFRKWYEETHLIHQKTKSTLDSIPDSGNSTLGVETEVQDASKPIEKTSANNTQPRLPTTISNPAQKPSSSPPWLIVVAGILAATSGVWFFLKRLSKK